MPRSLHLKSLKLRNFKGIADLDLAFDDSLTLLAGVNGAGKTSVIQALLAVVTRALRSKPPYDYPLFDIPGSVSHSGAPKCEVVLEFGATDRAPFKVAFSLADSGWEPAGMGHVRLMQLMEGIGLPLPLVVYYEQDRVAQPPSGGWNVPVSMEGNRASSLCTTISSPSEFKAWFFEKEADESQVVRERRDVEYQDRELAVVRGLLAHLGEFTAVRSRKSSDSSERILFLEKDGANIPFDSLSGGEQAFFLLVADLARRLMLAFPDMPVAKAPGVVCIDEIELHLHPAWQRRILKTLMEMFPACQFVVSTHSPQVIGGVEAHHVRLLTLGENGIRKVTQPLASKGRDSNYILKGILDTPERDDDVSHLFAEFDRLADAGELEDAERVLEKLDEAVEGQSSGDAIRQAKWNRLRRAAK